jgi:transposase
MELEVFDGETEVSREFKLEAVKLVTDRGMAASQAARDLGIHANVLREWLRAFPADPQQAFPGRGQMKPEQLEIAQLQARGRQPEGRAGYPKKAAAYFAKEST